MRTVNLRVTNEYVEGAGIVAGAQGSNNSTTIHVEFINWSSLNKYVTLRDAKGENPTMIMLGLDHLVGEDVYEFPIPGIVMGEQGNMSITFTGFEVVDGNEVETATNTAYAT